MQLLGSSRRSSYSKWKNFSQTSFFFLPLRFGFFGFFPAVLVVVVVTAGSGIVAHLIDEIPYAQIVNTDATKMYFLKSENCRGTFQKYTEKNICPVIKDDSLLKVPPTFG